MLAKNGCAVICDPNTGLKVCAYIQPRRDHHVHIFDSRETLTKLRPSLNVQNLPLLIFVNKGIEVGTNALTLDIIADTCGKEAARAATFIVSSQTILPHDLSFDCYPPVRAFICKRK
jgi:hypothetical protein